jgi:hypothetical protein
MPAKGQVNWRREAREDFDFEAGEQTNEEDKAILQDAKRPIVIFNRVGTTVDSVSGQEVGDRRYGAPLLTRMVCLKYPDLFRFAELEVKIAESLRPRPQIFLFCGDYRRRLVRSRLPPEPNALGLQLTP